MAKLELDIDADIKPVSDFRANTASVLKQVQETGRPLILTQRGRSAAVLLDVRSYQALLDELDELKDVQRGIADAEAGRVDDHHAVMKRLQERYQ